MKARDPKDFLGRAEVSRFKFNSSVIHDVEIKYPSSVNYRYSLNLQVCCYILSVFLEVSHFR